ncbi:tyrosine-type recombinase/integrase [Alcaligenaceae bacterium]|nr:tyrosine-type recombinase/integrase [Alcaligenaceae bacterium]
MVFTPDFSAALTESENEPFQAILTAPELDGSTGLNRAHGNQSQIAANTDIDAIIAWLTRFTDSPNTLANYRKEAERLLLWSTGTMQKPVSSLTHEDLLAYQRFLSDPQPASQWIMGRGRKLSRTHNDWRPFVGPLSPSSRRQATVILNGMFSWLVAAGYLAGNPLSLSRQRARKAQARVTRYLDEDTWSEVKQTIDALPRDTKRNQEHYLRLRWLLSLLYLCGLRISEVTQNTMGGFFCRRTADGQISWWLEVTGKGEKIRTIPATHELMIELANYRREKGYPPYPAPDETTPLLLPIGTQVRPLTRAAVHTVLKQVFKSTAERIRTGGVSFEFQAQHVEQASAHWLRHTAGTHMANKQVDLRHVRDNLGHESISTTNIYLHSSDDARHRETEEHHKIDW